MVSDFFCSRVFTRIPHPHLSHGSASSVPCPPCFCCFLVRYIAPSQLSSVSTHGATSVDVHRVFVVAFSLPLVHLHIFAKPSLGRKLPRNHNQKERNRERENEGRQEAGREVCVATGALRKLRFSTNHSGRKSASGSWLRARPARAGSDSYCSSASGSHILVTRCVWGCPTRKSHCDSYASQ